MRAEKQILTKEYLGRLNGSPFFIVVNYTGLKVGPLTELRKRLNKARPNSLRGDYIQSCTLSATMSPPVRIDLKEFTAPEK